MEMTSIISSYLSANETKLRSSGYLSSIKIILNAWRSANDGKQLDKKIAMMESASAKMHSANLHSAQNKIQAEK